MTLATESEWAAQKNKFPKGTLVQLISGGPTMAVDGYVDASLNPREQNKIICQWFSGKKLEQGFFSPEALILAPKNDKEKQTS
jgi:uncharacterized protein YodC (DUF2158 family)